MVLKDWCKIIDDFCIFIRGKELFNKEELEKITKGETLNKETIKGNLLGFGDSVIDTGENGIIKVIFNNKFVEKNIYAESRQAFFNDMAQIHAKESYKNDSNSVDKYEQEMNAFREKLKEKREEQKARERELRQRHEELRNEKDGRHVCQKCKHYNSCPNKGHPCGAFIPRF